MGPPSAYAGFILPVAPLRPPSAFDLFKQSTPLMDAFDESRPKPPDFFASPVLKKNEEELVVAPVIRSPTPGQFLRGVTYPPPL